MRASTIAEAVEEMRRITERSIEEGSRIGYFAALYGRVTQAVEARIAAGGFFEDGPRMERLDVTFANRYFDALDKHRAGKPLAASWRIAFDAAARDDLMVLQHLYLGLNAHLLLDLGIAAAETCPGAALASVRGDFDRINEVVGSLMRAVDSDVGRVSPWMHLVDELAGTGWAGANDLAIHAARHVAWTFAEALAPLDEAARREKIEARDRQAALVGEQVLHPTFAARAAAGAIHGRETADVRTVIRTLRGDAEGGAA